MSDEHALEQPHECDVEEIVHATDDPVGEPPAFTHSLADALPYETLSWPNLEKLLKRIASRALGWDQVRIYGTPGQTQFGIDIIGIQPDGTYGAIQSKHYRSFDEADLKAAVGKFDPDKLPVKGITRLIVATAVATNRRQILDALSELRPTVTVALEFWDASNLDDSLNRHADLVARFFGMEAARQFCGYSPTLVEPPDPDRADIAMNVARGPESIPEVTAALARAQAQDVDPGDAAAAYADAQKVLRDARFAAHARVWDAARADSLLAAGQLRDAVVSLADAFWDALYVGEADEADAYARRLADLRDVSAGSASASETPQSDQQREETQTEKGVGDGEVEEHDPSPVGQVRQSAEEADVIQDPEFVDRLAGIVSIAQAVARTPVGDIDTICPKLDLPRLLTDYETDAVLCQHVGQLAVLVAQTALNDPLDTWAQRNVGQLRDVRSSLAAGDGSPASRPLQVALMVEIADASQDWVDPLRAVRMRELEREDCATVMARAALAHALRGRFSEADLAWVDAIEEACLVGHYSDAAEWVFARRNSLLAAHPWPTRDPNTFYRTAHGLQHLGGGPRQPTIRRVAERAADRALDDKTRAAALKARDYARRAYAVGSWRQYGHANTLLARAYSESEFHLDATARLIVAGETDKAVKAAEDARDTWLDVTPLLASTSPRTRAVSFRVLAAQGDLLPADQIELVEQAALEEVGRVLGPTPVAAGIDGTYLAALRALGSIASRLSLGSATELVDMLKPAVERKPGNYRHSDEWHVQTLAGIADQHQDLRDRALEQLVELGLSDSGASMYVNRHALPTLSRHFTIVDAMLKPRVDSGDQQAARLRARIAPDNSGTFSAEQVEKARQRLLAEPVRTPGVRTFGSQTGDDALVVQHLPAPQRLELVEALVGQAESEPPPSWDAMDHLAAAAGLGDELGPRPDLFARALAIATWNPPAIPSPLPSNQLSAVQMTGFETDPRPAAALLAARLASTNLERQAVQEACLNLLLWKGENARMLAFATFAAFGEDISAHLPMLVAQPDGIYRSLAAEAWVHTGAKDLYVGARLVQDPEPTVRRMLARHLARVRSEGQPLSEAAMQVAAALASDPRFSVRELIGGAD